MDEVLIAIRALHFAATIAAGGTVIFRRFISDPAGIADLPEAGRLEHLLGRMVWIGLAVAVASWIAWLLVLSADIGGDSLAELVSDGVIWTLVTQTRFGHAWSVRLLIAGLIAAGALRFDTARAKSPRWWRIASVVLAFGFLGALASSGHAGATGGTEGTLHWIADALHLIAAGAWVGGLVPLALLLAAARNSPERVAIGIATAATHRFSILGLTCVGTIAITGAINSWILVGGLSTLVETDYGRLLLVKIALFVAMVCIAAVNLIRLRPQLDQPRTIHHLGRNSLAEAGLGLLVIAIVSVLGTIPPGAHALHAH